MRLADFVLRQGHLSEKALLEAIGAIGNEARPAHLDRCDLCADRATELNDWLEAVRTTGIEAADAVFADEQLTLQRAHIMNRLEQADEPPRVIAFPRHTTAPQPISSGHRVAPAWLAVAAAAGIVLGVAGGQMMARMGLEATPTAVPPPATLALDSQQDPQQTEVFDPLEVPLEQYTPMSLQGMDELVPSMMLVSAGG